MICLAAPGRRARDKGGPDGLGRSERPVLALGRPRRLLFALTTTAERQAERMASGGRLERVIG